MSAGQGSTAVRESIRWAWERAFLKRPVTEIAAPGRILGLVLATKSDKDGTIPAEFTPSLKELSARSGLGTTAVSKHLAIIHDLGWIARRRRWNHEEKRNDVTLYRLRHPEDAWEPGWEPGHNSRGRCARCDGRPLVGTPLGGLPLSAERVTLGRVPDEGYPRGEDFQSGPDLDQTDFPDPTLARASAMPAPAAAVAVVSDPTELPPDWTPSQQHRRMAAKYGIDIHDAADAFRSYHDDGIERRRDWDKYFGYYLRQHYDGDPMRNLPSDLSWPEDVADSRRLSVVSG